MCSLNYCSLNAALGALEGSVNVMGTLFCSARICSNLSRTVPFVGNPVLWQGKLRGILVRKEQLSIRIVRFSSWSTSLNTGAGHSFT